VIVSRNKIKYDKNKTRNIADRVTKLTGSYENEPLQTYNIEETVVDASKENENFISVRACNVRPQYIRNKKRNHLGWEK
jgi:hypothetical protein